MKITFRYTLLIMWMASLASSCVSNKKYLTTEVEIIKTNMAEKFVKGFNTGRSDSLAPIVSKIFTNQFLENNGGHLGYAMDRMELYQTYGPLQYSFSDTSSTPTIEWYKGKISHGWVGFQFHLENRVSNKSERLTTWRARPVGFPEAPKSEKAVIDSINRYLNKLSEADLFDGTVTISHKGKILLNDKWGWDKKDISNPVDSITLFHTASVTKMFTAVLVLQLIQEGNLSLEDTIGKYIPEYPEPYRSQVKVIHLLTHTSGIRLMEDVDFLITINSAENVDALIDAQIHAIKNRVANISPGSEYSYSSEGFDILGAIAEKVTGKSWKALVEERIFNPSGMTYSRVNIPQDKGNFAIGKTSLNEGFNISKVNKLKSSIEILPKYAKPSSGIWSNSFELHKFMQAILTYKLLNKEMTDRFIGKERVTAEFPKYRIVSWIGLGAQGEDLWGIPTVGHGGVVPGYSSAIEYLPRNKWLLTVTSNTGEGTGYLVFQRFLELTAHYE